MSWQRQSDHTADAVHSHTDFSHDNGNIYDGGRNFPGFHGGGKIRQMKEGDWECLEPGCGNVNFSKRTKCHRCGVPKPRASDPLQDVPHFGGPKGLFKQGDWPCAHCGNVNWARRDKCNICNAPKPVTKAEPRMGRGGGHFDLQDPGDRNRHDSDNEEFDEFGRKKRKRLAHTNAANSTTMTLAPRLDAQATPMLHKDTFETQSTAPMPLEGSSRKRGTSVKPSQDTDTSIRMAFPSAPKLRQPSMSDSRSSSPSSRSSSDTSSSSSASFASARSTDSPQRATHYPTPNTGHYSRSRSPPKTLEGNRHKDTTGKLSRRSSHTPQPSHIDSLSHYRDASNGNSSGLRRRQT